MESMTEALQPGPSIYFHCPYYVGRIVCGDAHLAIFIQTPAS